MPLIFFQPFIYQWVLLSFTFQWTEKLNGYETNFYTFRKNFSKNSTLNLMEFSYCSRFFFSDRLTALCTCTKGLHKSNVCKYCLMNFEWICSLVQVKKWKSISTLMRFTFESFHPKNCLNFFWLRMCCKNISKDVWISISFAVS